MVNVLINPEASANVPMKSLALLTLQVPHPCFYNYITTMRMTARLLTMTNGLKVGQQLQGKSSIYTILEQMHSCIWIATYDPDSKP